MVCQCQFWHSSPTCKNHNFQLKNNSKHPHIINILAETLANKMTIVAICYVTWYSCSNFSKAILHGDRDCRWPHFAEAPLGPWGQKGPGDAQHQQQVGSAGSEGSSESSSPSTCSPVKSKPAGSRPIGLSRNQAWRWVLHIYHRLHPPTQA